MPKWRSEVVETITVDKDEAEQMLYAQDAVYERMKESITERQLITKLGSISSTILSFLFMLPTKYAVAGAISTIIGGISVSEKNDVLNSISNGLSGITKIMKASSDNNGKPVTAEVGFLVFDNLGIRTVSSRYPVIE
ncbi:hypothetical protein KQI88_05635 [Alkaliphilus sp. MSJ-5]|uniref:Uncharacterized protein n=1 Tax=Alkaliphilus flagellatus TaxID=2841507 RepID=A0ABS6G117_9FIRM|nr:hypothetical protein [Alkaliphilus flagellatus]MBU5675889.1 hypothetical protein [Alkaliphilus flagellatus]